jgi:restriction system protein
MARKDESILNLLVECPWWVSILVSGTAFVFLKFIFPLMESQSMAANSFARGLSSAAPFIALVLLLPAPIAALNSFLKKKRRANQKGFKDRRRR